MKVSSPIVPIEKSGSGGQAKNILVTSNPKKEKTSPTTTKVTQHDKPPSKNGKIGMFTLPYPVYNIDKNIMDDLKKFKANTTYFDLLKLTHQRDLLLKAMNEWNYKAPTTSSTQTKKPTSKIVSTTSVAQISSAMETMLSKMNLKPQDVNATMIGRKSKSMSPPFLITFEIFNMNVHNYLVHSRASSIVMPYVVAIRLQAILEETGT